MPCVVKIRFRTQVTVSVHRALEQNTATMDSSHRHQLFLTRRYISTSTEQPRITTHLSPGLLHNNPQLASYPETVTVLRAVRVPPSLVVIAAVRPYGSSTCPIWRNVCHMSTSDNAVAPAITPGPGCCNSHIVREFANHCHADVPRLPAGHEGYARNGRL